MSTARSLRISIFGIPTDFRSGCLVYASLMGCLPRLLDAAWWSPGAWAIVAVGSVLLLLMHELGHALAATLYAVPVRAIVIAGRGGQCQADLPQAGWGRVAYFSGGVLAQGAVGLLAAAALRWAPTPPGELVAAARFVFIQVNGAYIALNLLPVRNFDGRRIVHALQLIAARGRNYG